MVVVPLSGADWAPRDQPRRDPAGLSNHELTVHLMSPQAKCSTGGVDPDEWYPAAIKTEHARAESARAIAMCGRCPVRAECLEFSMRHWRVVGRHGVWGGLVETERAALRPAWESGTPVTGLLPPADPDP
jgi:WhiB family transcriptional regulator, redox-sensing transcriptional regulator